MTRPASTQFSGIFISYRRDDSAGHAGRLYDRLAAHFGENQIFMDIDHIKPGEDFAQVIEKALGSCAIMLVLIGRGWLTSREKTGRRLNNPDDYVRLEVGAALARDIIVIPVLLEGAQMPRPRDLPADLLPLARRNALELSDLRWNHDVERLIARLEMIIVRRRRVPLFAVVAAVISGLMALLLAGFMVSRWQAAINDNSNSSSNLNAAQPTPQSPPQLTPVPTPRISLPANPPPFRNKGGIEFVWIPPNEFRMGSENGDTDEKPVHRVTLGKGFYLGKYEVTNAQWRRVMGSFHNYLQTDNEPVVYVSWNDAQEFIGNLNALNDGYEYRLPTEAEWEYACRAGPTQGYAGELKAVAWYDDSPGGKLQSIRPVGLKLPNAFGLYDMLGNASEWCQDSLHTTYVGAPSDGSAWLSGNDNNRVLRGGSVNHRPPLVRCTVRYGGPPYERHYTFGMRVAAVARP